MLILRTIMASKITQVLKLKSHSINWATWVLKDQNYKTNGNNNSIAKHRKYKMLMAAK